MGLEPKVQKSIQLVERFWRVSQMLRSIGEYIPWFIDHYGDGGQEWYFINVRFKHSHLIQHEREKE
jgi:hypothetical protein